MMALVASGSLSNAETRSSWLARLHINEGREFLGVERTFQQNYRVANFLNSGIN